MLKIKIQKYNNKKKKLAITKIASKVSCIPVSSELVIKDVNEKLSSFNSCF